MRKRYTICCLLTLAAMILIFPIVTKASDIKMVLDGKYVYTDTSPVIVNGRVLVPVRAIFEALGGSVEWKPDENQVYGYKGARRVWLYINDTKAYLGNKKETQLDVPAEIIDGRTMVPLRFIAESLGCTVNWDSDNQIVILESSKNPPAEDILNLIKPSLVSLETEDKKGSGFFITADGQILTNAHVVTGSYEITVKTADDKSYEAVIDRIDPDVDLAILKIQNAKDTFQFITNQKKSDALKVGQEVIAIGNPFGLENSISSGILSGIRDKDGVKSLQTTAPLSPGNSGGPLLTMDAEVIGINRASITDGQNLNFAVPIDYLEALKGKPPFVINDDIKAFVRDRHQWSVTYKAMEKDLDEVEKSSKDEDYYNCKKLLDNSIIPKTHDLWWAVVYYSNSNSQVKECVDIYCQAMDDYYNGFRALSAYFDAKSKNLNDSVDLYKSEDLTSEGDYLMDKYHEKLDDLWSKNYK